MALSTAQRLEASIALTAADLGLSADVYAARLVLWEELAQERADTTAQQQQAQIRALALTAWIVALSKKVDKFRAEGEITSESDMLGRIALLQGWLVIAERDSASPIQVASANRNPAPEFEEWGLR